ncbi:MAG: GatB/YqeY domain-containing protein [Bacteroidales bacterium]|nr:GatB/YqeY domain-containing protein [Bacteroidales bacterium]
MTLTEKIAADLITAMKSKDTVSLEALRAAKTAFLLALSEKGSGSSLTPEEETRIIQKLVKQRRESAQIYRENNRTDLSDKETSEADVLEKYLPAKMSEEELERVVRAMIGRVGAKSASDLGKVMGPAMKELAGKADGKEISAMVRKLLG